MKPSIRMKETESLTQEITTLYHKSRRRYGSPKIMKQLMAMGWKVSRPRVARIMRKQGLRSIINKKFRGATTDSAHNYPIAENHLDRNFTAEKPSQKWVSDITYIPTSQGWLYLTIIMDLFDRKVVGWSMSGSLKTIHTTLPAWRMAIKNRPIKNHELLFHSDRGVQYASTDFRNDINAHSVKQSMSRKGNCWDNAVAENFFKILKSELVKHYRFESFRHAKTALFEYIEAWYNKKRIHAYLDYKTPEEFEQQFNLKRA